MKLVCPAFENGASIPERFAFGKRDAQGKIALSDNVSPPLRIEDVPSAAKSLVLLCYDSEVPSKGDDVNQDGRTVPYALPRVDFFHWVAVDLAPATQELPEGAFAQGITAKGKKGPQGPLGTRIGLNDYTQWFKGDGAMEGEYFGYDGPCPPFNDERRHRYHFKLYALDVERCPVEGTFDGVKVRKAMEGHVLDRAEYTGSYAIYANARD